MISNSIYIDKHSACRSFYYNYQSAMGNNNSNPLPEPAPVVSKPEPPMDEASKPESTSICITPEPSKPEPNARADWKFTPSNNDTSFATLSFAEGVSRRAYRAMRWKPTHKYGMKAVLKEYKHDYQWAQSDWDTSVRLYETANELAEEFNKAMTKDRQTHTVDYEIQKVTEKDRQIHIVDYGIQKVTFTSDNTVRPKLNEYVLVEDYLEGEFEKYISNTGWVNQVCCMEYLLMPAFTHWSWVHTRGDLMITDLQGVRYDDKYVLTDPCVLSMENKEYGATDNSVIGMALFFSSHVCNSACRELKIKTRRPDIEPIEEYMMASSIKIKKATSYISKGQYAKIPNEIKIKIKEALQDVFKEEICVN